MPETRLFTVDQANEAIPFLERRLERLSRRLSELERVAPAGDEEMRRLGQEGGRLVPPAYFRGIQQILEDSSTLTESGIILRDLKRGLVDFPARLDGKQVFLCWVKGETEVSYFHEPGAGFAGRKPLPADPA